MQKRTDGFWRSVVGMGVALGVTFMSGFVHVVGKPPYNISISRQRGPEKPAQYNIGDGVPDDGE